MTSSHHRPLSAAVLLTVLAGLVASSGEANADGAAKVAVTDFFAGRVTKVKPDGQIELRYDFEEASQLADFEDSLPFRAVSTVKNTLENGRVRLKGTGSLRHKAVFRGLVTASATFTPSIPYDFGFSVSESTQSEIFTLYCVRDRYFSKGDGVLTPQNMIIKFIPRDAGRRADGYQDWRYCGSRGADPEVFAGKGIAVAMRREGLESWMQIGGDWTSKGKEASRDLTTQMVAIYGYKADVRFDDLVISGRLSPDFIQANSLDLDVPPDPAGGAESPPDTAPSEYPEEAARLFRDRIAAYPHQTKHRDLAKMLGDVTVPVSLRQEAAAKAVESADKRLVPFLVEVLYSPDEGTRGVGIDVVKSLAGKDFGFRAGDAEEKRTKAIQKLLEHVQKYEREFR